MNIEHCIQDRGGIEKKYDLHKQSLDEITGDMSLQLEDKGSVIDMTRQLEPVTREGYLGIAANYRNSIDLITNEHQKKKTDLDRALSDVQKTKNSIDSVVLKSQENTNLLRKLDSNLQSAAPIHDYIRKAKKVTANETAYSEQYVSRYKKIATDGINRAQKITLAFDGLSLNFSSEGHHEIEDAISAQQGNDQSDRGDRKQIKAPMADTTWKRGISPEQIDPMRSTMRQPAYDSGTEIKKGYINTTPSDYQR